MGRIVADIDNVTAEKKAEMALLKKEAAWIETRLRDVDKVERRKRGKTGRACP